jgi:tripartite-type tricarboxylate transporter receptor subunit TctC
LKLRSATSIVLLCAAGVLSDAALSQTQRYPMRPVRIINPTQPGGPSDLVARSLAQKFTETMGYPFVVDNRPGANGIIGVELVAKAAPDGYTLLLGTNGQLTVNPALFAKLPFDSLRDLTPITIVITSPFMLVVNASVPAKTVAELVALAKAKPGMTYSSFGPGSFAHFGMELVMLRTGMQLIHVPYKGGGPSGAALVSGEVHASFDSVQNQLQYIRSGRVRALAVVSPSRLKVLPDVPTMAEVGLAEVDIGGWYSLLGPARLPKPIVDRLYAETVKAFSTSPEMRERFESVGSSIVLNKPEEFAALLKREVEQFRKIARAANITANP